MQSVTFCFIAIYSPILLFSGRLAIVGVDKLCKKARRRAAAYSWALLLSLFLSLFYRMQFYVSLSAKWNWKRTSAFNV